MKQNRNTPFWKKGWTGILLEVVKWAFVVWLLRPWRQAASMRDAVRVVLGVLLFIIFTGKLFYDTVFLTWIQQRRTSAKQDLLALLGIVIALALLVGAVMVFAGWLLIEVMRSNAS